jgi:hypothetical protein
MQLQREPEGAPPRADEPERTVVAPVLHPRVGGPRLPDDLARLVGGRVVDDDQREVPGALPEQGLDRRSKVDDVVAERDAEDGPRLFPQEPSPLRGFDSRSTRASSSVAIAFASRT